jgi:hypothetical protein
MGMFDYVNVSMKCPKCEKTLEFQTKASDCLLDLVDATAVDYFYAYCSCGIKVDVLKERNRTSVREIPYTPEELKNMGYTITLR